MYLKVAEKRNKNPNRPKGRGIFNVSDTSSDNGELIQNNPTTASSGVSETNESAITPLLHATFPAPAYLSGRKGGDNVPAAASGSAHGRQFQSPDILA